MKNESFSLRIGFCPRENCLELIGSLDFEFFLSMPFCSANLCLPAEENNLIMELISGAGVFWRQARISQLQNLFPSNNKRGVLIPIPFFNHTRYNHALMVAMMGMAILEKALKDGLQLKKKEIISFVLACLYHDAATPAGGDQTKALFGKLLCEEENFFNHLLNSKNFVQKWKKYLPLAQQYVLGKGKLGKLLDYLDKISYVLLDLHGLRFHTTARLAKFMKDNPFSGDVWLDINFANNGKLYFSNPKKLHDFLLVRALMHVELYKNPASRKIEKLLAQKTAKLVEAKITSLEDFQKHDDQWLFQALEENGFFSCNVFDPDKIQFRKFDNEESCRNFGEILGQKLIAVESIGPFKTGLDWPVRFKGKIIPLNQAISQKQINQLAKLSNAKNGWYVYFYK